MQARNERRKTDLPINLCDLAKVDSLEKLIVYQLFGLKVMQRKLLS